MQQQQQQELTRRIECSVECREDNHVEWALNKIAVLSTANATKTKKKFKIDSIRGLLPLLISRIQIYLQNEYQPTNSTSMFNDVKLKERLDERLAFISLIILRNCSFDPQDQLLMVSAQDDYGKETLLQVLLSLLNRKNLHLEWKIKILDILHNLSVHVKLATLADIVIDSLFVQISSCLIRPDDVLVEINALEILNSLVYDSNEQRISDLVSEQKISDRVKQNAQLIEKRLNQDVHQPTLFALINYLKTSSAVNHLNEPNEEDDDFDDEIKEVEEGDAEVIIEENEESEVEKHKTLENQKQQQEKMKKEKSNEPVVPENNVSKLDEMSLLLRALTIHFLTRIVQLSTEDFVKKLANTNQCVTRLVELMVWKSGLQSRMASHSFQMMKNLKDQQRKREKEYYGQAQYQHGLEPDDEDFDQDEIFDDYGDENAPKDLSASQLFQRKCATILAHISKLENKLIQQFSHEIMFLIMFTKAPVSTPLSRCIE